jgi:hypothetical protein
LTNNPAQRRPDESPRAHARFLIYRALPAHSRTLAEVARVCGVSRQAIFLQAKRHEWAERAAPVNVLGAMAYGGRNPLLDLIRQKAEQASFHKLHHPVYPL